MAEDVSMDLVLQVEKAIRALNDAIIELHETRKKDLKLLKERDSELKKAKTTVDSLKKGQDDLAKSVKEKEKADKEAKKIAATLENERQKAIKTAEKLAIKEKQLQKDAVNQGKSIDDLKAKIKALNTLRNREQRETDESRAKFKQYTEQLKMTKTELQKTTGVGGGLTKALKSQVTTLVATAGAYLGIRSAIRGVSNAIRTFAGFDRQISKVGAVSGATGSELISLRKLAQDLGESTEKTASEVAQLEINLAKLGFTSTQILDATAAVLDLSTAADADLGQAATVAAATVKGFGLTAKETTRVADVMALSFASSALDISKFENAMSKVAPVATNADVSVERATASLSLLVDRGLEASIAGTSLRNIFLELSKQGLTWEEAMGKIRNATDKNKTAMELFGKRGATAAIILADNAREGDLLTKKYEGAAGAAKRMADVMRDNLVGDADKARSALEGLAINLGTKLNPFLRSATQLFTKFIGVLNKGASSLSTLNEFNSELSTAMAKTKISLKENGDKLDILITRYTELLEIGEPNKKQQDEIETIIGDIVKIVPSAATEIDKYGKVLGINTGLAEGFVTKQQEILNELTELSTPKIVSDLAVTLKEISKLEGELRVGRETTFGTFRELTKVEAIQNNISIDNLKKRKKLTLELLTSAGLEENKLISSFSDEFSVSETNLRNKLIGIVRTFLINKRKEEIKSIEEEKALAKKAEEDKIKADKLAAELKLAEDIKSEIKRQEEVFKIKKKYGLVTDEEIYEHEINQIKKSKDFAILSEQEKIIVLAGLWDVEFARRQTIIDKQKSEIAEAIDKLAEEIDAPVEEDIEEGLEEENEAKLQATQDFLDKKAQLEADDLKRIQDLEEAKRAAKFATLDATIAIFGQETAIGKIALAIKKADAIRENLISLGIIQSNQAVAVSNAAKKGFPFNIPLIAATILQFASIFSLFNKSKKFKTGTKGKFSTPANFVTSEDGKAEITTDRSGKSYLTTKPTLFTDMAGSRVTSNPELKKITDPQLVAMAGINQTGHDPIELKIMTGKLIESNKKIERAITNKEIPIIDRRGIVIGKRTGNFTQTYRDKLYDISD